MTPPQGRAGIDVVSEALADLYERCRGLDQGEVAEDLDRVTAVDATAEAMLRRALTLLAERGHRIVLVGDVLGSGPWERSAGA
jgi:fructose-1,6-bisphosphatase/inositol monophosphatase family enzyme